ncbi:uncharacterized protein LOC129228383, partial [Uloborus diversus]|uniref:uncharacterized protein LOC129228383 n=1 Tax=Uloborus diversus TaxID=327109 RepID=UPI002409E0F4
MSDCRVFSDVTDKCNELIAVGPYVTLYKDPSIREVNLIKNVVKSSPIISESSKRSLTPSVAHCARFYALPKVHKPDIPLRPIVSNIGTASYKLAKYLVSIFSSLLVSNSFTVRNTVHFVQKLRYFKPHGLTMASFNVKSLFTNVPVVGALDCLKLRLQEHHFSSFEIEELVSLTRVCLELNTFVFNDTYFRMSEGLAMGNPLSPILSDIYMHYFETKLFETITFPFYVRYVDDCFVLLDQNHVDNEFLLSTLNSIDPCIQFTIEMETDSSLSFLDVFITKSNDEFMTSVFRKPFAVTLPPHKCSSHPPNQKLASFKAFVFRALNICSSSNSLNAELSCLKAVAFDRGYSPSIIDSIYNKLIKPSHSEKVSASSASYTIVLPYYPKVSHQVAKILKKFGFDTAFSPVNKIKFTNLKDPIDCHSNWGIYSISCKCGLGYVGQTKRALKHRLKEHENYVKHK